MWKIALFARREASKVRSIEVLAALAEHLDGDVVRDALLLDEFAREVEFGLAGRGEADLDLLEAYATSRSN